MSLLGKVFGPYGPSDQEEYEQRMQQLRLDEAVAKKKAQLEYDYMRAAQNAGMGSIQQAAMGIGVGPYQLGQQMKASVKRLNPNEIPAMQMPLESLVDLWQAKWQDTWVHRNEASADAFWARGFQRLFDTNKLERFEDYYRIIPNANR